MADWLSFATQSVLLIIALCGAVAAVAGRLEARAARRTSAANSLKIDGIAISMDGRLHELVQALEAKSAAEKQVAFTEGRTAGIDAAVAIQQQKDSAS